MQRRFLKKMEVEGNCELEAEIGRVRVENGNNIVASHQPKERIHSQRYTALAVRLGPSLSFRDGSGMLNTLLHRDESTSIKLRTYSDFCMREGEKLSAYIANETEKILETAQIDPKTGQAGSLEAIPDEWKEAAPPTQNEAAIEQARAKINAQRTVLEEQVRADAPAMEDPEQTCYISIDEVGVKHQKENRPGEAEKQHAYVWNSVATVESQGSSYTLTHINMLQLFLTLLAYLVHNCLLKGKNLVFFTDGARDIQSNIEKLFSFHPYTIILDWYHLKKRCQEYLSMSIQGGKEKRNQVLQKLLRILWVGNVTEAIDYLQGLNPSLLRSENRIGELCRYFERHRDHIPSYALRRELGLRISSHRVEKANDLVVAQRQKNNGMSWSTAGSGSLAQLKALSLNGETDLWLTTHSLAAFRPAA